MNVNDEAFDSPEAWEACWCHAGAAEWPGSKDRDGVDKSCMKLHEICLLPKGIPEIVCCRVECVWIIVWWPNRFGMAQHDSVCCSHSSHLYHSVLYLKARHMAKRFLETFRWILYYIMLPHITITFQYPHLSTVLSPKVWRLFLAVEIFWICRLHWHLAGSQVGRSTVRRSMAPHKLGDNRDNLQIVWCPRLPCKICWPKCVQGSVFVGLPR